MSKQEIDRPSLEYNLAGGLLLTLTPTDLERLCSGIKMAGYEHACVLPFRGLTETLDPLRPLTVIHVEKAWNPTPHDSLPVATIAGLAGYAKRFLGDQNQPPILQDALFPGRKTCEQLFQALVTTFPGTKFISHEIDFQTPRNRLLIEINEGIKLTSQELIEISHLDDFRLVFDPSHLLPSYKIISLSGQPTCQPKGEWEKQFNAFSGSGRIEVVDINPPQKSDISDLLKGKGLLAELAVAAKEVPSVRFLRVEIRMPILTQIPMSPKQQEGFEFLREIGQVLKTV